METFNIHEAKTHFSKLVDSVMQGNEIVIAKASSSPDNVEPCFDIRIKISPRLSSSKKL